MRDSQIYPLPKLPEPTTHRRRAGMDEFIKPLGGDRRRDVQKSKTFRIDEGKLKRWCVRRLLEGWSNRDASALSTKPKPKCVSTDCPECH